MSHLDGAAMRSLQIHGQTITTAELERLGFGLGRRNRLVATGQLVRVVDGVYVFGGAVLDEPALGIAVCTGRPDVVIAGPTAGRHWALRRVPEDGLIHVLAPPASHR